MEEPLAGGNVADSVVRVGDTVRKPWIASTPAVHAFLEHLAERGFAGAPRAHGRDERGRQILDFVPGTNAELLPSFTDDELYRLGAMVRELHDASEDFVPPGDARWTVAIPADGADLVCHQDLAPWNLIRDGERWVFVDWDASAPGTRLWDLAYVVQTFVPLIAGGDPRRDGWRVQRVVEGYRLDRAARAALPEVMARRTRAMYDLLERGGRTGEQPWSLLWAEGHGPHWAGAAEYVSAHLDAWS